MWLLFAASGLLLLLACANVTNLLLARATARGHELALRRALGAAPGRLARQTLAESLLLASIGGAAGVVLAVPLVRIARAFLQPDLPAWMTITLDVRVLLFAIAVTLLTAVVAGAAPAVEAFGASMATSIRGAARGQDDGPTQRSWRTLLIVGQVALASLLLVAAGVMVRTWINLQAATPGFDADRLLTFRVDPPAGLFPRTAEAAEFYRRAIERLAVLPGAEAAATNENLPLAGQHLVTQTIALEGQDAAAQARNPFITVQTISDNYLRVMRVPLVRGRAFTPHDLGHTTPVALVSRALGARLWGDADPIGRRVRLGGTQADAIWREVVGIADDVRHASLAAGPSLDLYVPQTQRFANDTYFVVRTRQDPRTLEDAAARAVREVYADQSIFDVRPMTARAADTVARQRASQTVFVGFAALALLLAAVGLFGVMSFAVSRRTREIGLRMAIGASPDRVRWAIVRQGLTWVAAGLALGLLTALPSMRLLAGLLYGVTPADPVSYAAAAVVLFAAGWLACELPARRAMRVDPLIALKQE